MRKGVKCAPVSERPNLHFMNTKPSNSFFEVIHKIRINKDYIDTYNSDDHDKLIFKLFADYFDTLPVNDRPLVTIKQNDSNCHIIYIYDDGCWKKETELELFKQLIYEYEDDIAEDQQKLLLQGLTIFTRNTLEDIQSYYPNNIRLYRENQYNFTYIKNKINWLNFMFGLNS